MFTDVGIANQIGFCSNLLLKLEV